MAPQRPLNPWFLEIVQQGTGKEFTVQDNAHWTAVTRPIVEAFFHARYFLEMVCKYGRELEFAPTMLPSGWAAVLYLYNLRSQGWDVKAGLKVLRLKLVEANSTFLETS